MFGQATKYPAIEPEPIEEDTLSTAQEATPVPMVAGRRRLALHWITPLYNQKWVEAKDERPGKK